MAGMAKQSAYLQRRDAQLDAVFWAGAAMAAQFAVDTLQMTMHQKEGWGYDRIMRVTHEWMETQREYRPALNCKDPEADVRQVHMDRVLTQIISGKQELHPFESRYPELKKIKYRR
jgi:hypothetical protein